MNISDSDIQLIEDAVLDRLADMDQPLLEERIRDVQFAKELERHKLMIEMIKSEGRSELKAGFQKIDKELSQGPNIRQRSIPMYVRWLVAASLIGIFGYLGIYRSNSNNNLNIYNKYYELYPNLIDPITKGTESGDMSPYQLYEAGRHEAAQLVFSDLDESEERDFYFALAYLGMEDFETSITKLSKMSNDDSHRFFSDARWYLVLAHLGAQNIEKAKAILTEISKEENNPFREWAIASLEDLE